VHRDRYDLIPLFEPEPAVQDRVLENDAVIRRVRPTWRSGARGA
jgi:hypothetical protein